MEKGDIVSFELNQYQRPYTSHVEETRGKFIRTREGFWVHEDQVISRV